ncbi:MAG TPA: hypothetical protein VGB83_08360 [Actinomycetota bacterium]
MASEFNFQRLMTKPERAGYVGALMEDQNQAVLVPIDPADPWEAFRTVRRTMRKSRGKASFALYEADGPLEATANVIDLRSRRRAG